ncbi:MAG: TetR/AcrR family transcriptional regulator [Clostridiales bacterium]|nr:TetR/AcrR family transcriptional regulator [Clostridiales bacterium]
MGKALKTKNKILHNAAEIIAKKGYHATATKEISMRANLSEGILFKHFKSKENLLLEILMEMAVNLKNEAEIKKISHSADDKKTSAIEKLRTEYQEYTSFFKKHETTLKIILQELSINLTVRKYFEEDIRPLIIDPIEKILFEGIKNGEFKVRPTQTLSIGLFDIMLAPYSTMALFENNLGEIDSNHNQILFDVYIEGIIQ